MSEIRAATISNAAGTGPIVMTGQAAAKAWAKYDQTVPSVTGSFNLSSMTDSGVGLSIFNITNAFAAADYANLAWVQNITASTALFSTAVSVDAAPSTTTFSVRTQETFNTATDGLTCYNLTGDLA